MTTFTLKIDKQIYNSKEYNISNDHLIFKPKVAKNYKKPYFNIKLIIKQTLHKRGYYKSITKEVSHNPPPKVLSYNPYNMNRKKNIKPSRSNLVGKKNVVLIATRSNLYSENYEIDNKHISSRIKNFKIENRFINNKSNENQHKNLIHYPSSTKEWSNSVYSYNKSYIKPLVVLDLIIHQLFDSFFNMWEDYIKPIFKSRRAKKYNYSTNRVHLSRPEIKHTNTGVSILFYIHNRSMFIHEECIKELVHFGRIKDIVNHFETNYIIRTKNRLWYTLKERFSLFILLDIVVFNFTNSLTMKLSNILKTKNSEKFKLLRKLSILKNFSIFNFIESYRLEEVIFKNVKFISFNTSKFNNVVIFLRNLGIGLFTNKIYNKNVKIKIINLKSIHLNSDVLSSAMSIKLRNRKNNTMKILKKTITNLLRIPSLHTLIVNANPMVNINKNNVIFTLRDQIISGATIEASGRLTRRLTALRAVFKRRYIGSSKDIRSSYIRKSSTLLRGYLKSNLQYTIDNSKTRNGTFGLKTWLSSH